MADIQTYNTIEAWADMVGKDRQTVMTKVRRAGFKGMSLKSEMSADDWAKVYGKQTKTVQSKAKKQSVFSPAPAVQNVVPSEPIGERDGLDIPTLATVRSFLLDALLIGIVVGHAGLIWYDCAAMWSEPGQIGGGLAFGIILAAVMLATDSTKNITSQWALILALLVDVGAYWVHFPTFQTYSVPDAITSVLCVFLCTMSFGALFLYRHLKNN